MYKKPRLLILFLILLTVSALYIDLPKINLFGKTVSHPQINSKLAKRDLEPKLGLDLAGGVQLTLSADMQNVEEKDRDNALESAKTVVGNRVNSLGVAEPIVQDSKTRGQYRLIVEIPGISDIDQAVATVRKTAHLEFRELKQETSEASLSGRPEDFKATGLTGKDLKRAQANLSSDPQTPGYIISLEFTARGAKQFEEITRRNLQKPLAMFLDNEPISWPPPIVQAIIADGSAQITGKFTSQQARNLAIQLNAGALPVPLHIESQTRIGPTIGRESIDKSLIATVVGLASVAFFMIVYYRLLGVFAIVALAIYTSLVLAIFKLIPVTLTLAGIAGFVLSIGMAVDANILIFERIKEEIRWGKSKSEAFFAGFERAWSSIRDSNVSSLITTAILFNFGTGAIRGFALTLAIGIIVSMFSAITVSRLLIRLFWVRKI